MQRALISAVLVVLLALAAGPAAAQRAPGDAAGGARGANPGGAPQLDAKAWILIDARDGEQLAARSPNKELPIASATKLMTTYLALNRLEPKEKLKAPAYQASDIESLIGLRKGERMSVRDLIYALVLESANDAAETVAIGVSGSIPSFVGEMNNAAAALGLTHTSFSNPVGLDQPGNFSSARDLVTLADELLEDRLFAKAADSPVATLKTGDRPRTIDSRNLLLGREPFVTGVKTGHTLGAGYVLVGSGERHGTTLISAVLGAPSEAARDAQTLDLLDYGFGLYQPQTPVEDGEELATPEIKYRGEELALVAAKPLEISIRQGEGVDTTIDAPEEVDGPIEEGEKLGEASVTVDGRPAGSVPLVAAEAVPAASFARKAVATIISPLVLLPLGLIVIVVGMFLAGRGGAESPPKPEVKPKPRPKGKSPAKPKQPKKKTSQQRTAAERERMRKERMKRRNSKAK